jgi:hypothetical protein
MRLIGSLTEDDLREQLSASNASLREGGGSPALRAALIACGVDPTTAFVLDWIPEQGEDIYTVLDGTRRVLTVELPRGEAGGPSGVKAVPFADFRASIARGSRRRRLQFAVAMAMLREVSGDGS